MPGGGADAPGAPGIGLGIPMLGAGNPAMLGGGNGSPPGAPGGGKGIPAGGEPAAPGFGGGKGMFGRGNGIPFGGGNGKGGTPRPAPGRPPGAPKGGGGMPVHLISLHFSSVFTIQHTTRGERERSGHAVERGCAHGSVSRKHGVLARLSSIRVRGGNGIDDRLRFFVSNLCVQSIISHVVVAGPDGQRVSRTLVVVDYISEMVTTAVVGLSHTHTVVSEVDIAVIA